MWLSQPKGFIVQNVLQCCRTVQMTAGSDLEPIGSLLLAIFILGSSVISFHSIMQCEIWGCGSSETALEINCHFDNRKNHNVTFIITLLSYTPKSFINVIMIH